MAKRLYIQLRDPLTEEGITLPLNPETTDIPCEREIKTYNILGNKKIGEVPVSGNLKLKRITLTNFLPELNSTWALLASMMKNLKYQVYTPIGAMELFNKWVENGTIIRVIISGYINARFKVEKHTASIKESTEALYYSLDLVEYKEPGVDEVKEKSNWEKIKEKAGEKLNKEGSKTQEAIKWVQLKKRSIEKYIPSKYIAPEGATIYKIAKLHYGGRSNELAKINNIADENLAIAGRVIEMISLEKTMPNVFK